MDSSTRHLVEHAMDTNFDSLSTNDIHQCKRRLIDSFGCAMGSFDHPLSVSMRQLAKHCADSQGASIWGTKQGSTPEMAAFVNGVMLRVGENSDTFVGAGGGGHPSDMISALVAVAESEDASGESLIAATVIAYDVYCQLMDSVNLGAKGFDQVIHVVLGAVLGVSKLMKLTHEQMGHAVSLALAPNIALRQTRHGELSSWKGCAGANAARNAVFAATLAKCGVEGPASIFEGKQGLWSVVGEFAWPSAEQFKTIRMITRTSIKSLPICYHTQSGALAALELRRQLKPDEIESIDVQTYQTAVEMAGSDATQWAPRTSESADHSLPFVVATALARGAVDAAGFAVDRLTDPQVLGLMAKVRVNNDPILTSMWPETAPARLVIRTIAALEFQSEVLYPKGHVSNPLSDAELDDKFNAMFSIYASAGQSENALAALWRLDQCCDIKIDVLDQLARRDG